MNDIDRSYNANLLGLLQSAEKHNATVYTGSGTLSQIALAVGDYGHLPSFIERVREQFLYTDTFIFNLFFDRIHQFSLSLAITYQ